MTTNQAVTNALLARQLPMDRPPLPSSDEEALTDPLFSPTDALNVSKAAVAAALKGAAAAAPMLGMVLGRRAHGADLSALARAQKHPVESSATLEHGGWYQGPDKQWRYEAASEPGASSLLMDRLVPDRFDSKIYGVPLFQDKEAPIRLPEVLAHPELYKSYPELKEAMVRSTGLNFGMKGAADTRKNTIYLTGGTLEDLRSVLEHEIQHLIQYKERFARGGSPEEFSPPWLDAAMESVRSRLRGLTNKITGNSDTDPYSLFKSQDPNLQLIPRFKAMAEDLRRSPYRAEFQASMDTKLLYDKMSDRAYRKYHNLAGEVEARLAQLRMPLSRQQRLDVHPLSQMDVPSAKQVILFESDR